MGNLRLTSSAFTDGAEIPRKFGYKNGNVSPPLTIRGYSHERKSLALSMDDPDAMGAVGKVWVHWVVWNIPPSLEIAQNPMHPNLTNSSHCIWIIHNES